MSASGVKIPAMAGHSRWGLGFVSLLMDISTRSHRWRWTSRPDLGERWPSRLVAMAAEDRLSIRRNAHKFAAASDRTIVIYEYTPLVYRRMYFRM
jgi:hypothetical protein